MSILKRCPPALPLAALLAIFGAATAAAQDGAISGTVTTAATGLPIVGAPVSICLPNGVCTTVLTNGAGDYFISRPAGRYYAFTAIPGTALVNEYFNDIPCGAGCGGATAAVFGHSILVQAAKTRTGIDFALAPGATVSGRVVDAATGAAIGGVQVAIWTFFSTTRIFAASVTDAAGDYSVAGLTAGTYYAYTFNDVGYVDEIYDNLACVVSCESIAPTSPGTAIAVASGATVSGRNFALASGGSITGQVTDAATGAPLKNIDIIVLPRGGTSDVNARYGLSDASGLYVVQGLPTGSYVALASRGLTNYTGEVFDNVLCTGGCSGDNAQKGGTAIAVTVGNTTGGVNFALSTGSRITGTITSSVTGLPLPAVFVWAFRRVGLDFTLVGAGFTLSAGQYSIAGLPPGTYFLQTNTTQSLNETFRDLPCPAPCSRAGAALGEPIVLSGEPAVSDKDFQLDRGASVAGTVTTSAGVPLAEIAVEVHRQVGPTTELVAATTSAFSGAYLIAGLTPGPYLLIARDRGPHIFVDELFGGLQCPACAGAEILGGTTVVIPGGLGTTGRDFVLDPASRIAGRVTDVASGAPLANVAVNVYTSGGAAHPVGTATTGVDGSYEVRGLPAATHFASTANAPRHLNEIFNDVPCAAGICTPGATTSTGAALVVNGTLTGVDFALTQRTEAPTAPTNLSATALGFAVQVSWTAPAGGAPATSYVLEAGVAPGHIAVTAPVATPSLFVPGVNPGTYFLRVRGVNAFGVGPASAEFTLTINANGSSTPLPPTSLVAWTSASRLTATWVGPAAGPTPTSFVLEAGSATGASNIGVIEVPATAFTFESVPPGFYFLRVRSKFGGVLSATTAEAMINVGNVPAPPSPPQALSSSVVGATVTFTWAAPAIGTPTSYVLEAGSAPGLSNLAVFDTGTTATMLVVPGVPPGAYYVRLRARNAQGNGVSSTERLVVVP